MNIFSTSNTHKCGECEISSAQTRVHNYADRQILAHALVHARIDTNRKKRKRKKINK